MKVSTRPELFLCSEVIGWILPRVDVTTIILENISKQGYTTYSLLMSPWHIIFLLLRFTE